MPADLGGFISLKTKEEQTIKMSVPFLFVNNGLGLVHKVFD